MPTVVSHSTGIVPSSPNALAFWELLLRPLISPVFHQDFPSQPQISEEGLHQGHPSGALAHRNHPKQMEMVSPFGEGGEQQNHEESTNILGT